MTWNYQILKHKEKKNEETFFGIHEVYRDDNNKINACTVNSLLTRESKKDLIKTLEMMLKDCKSYPIHSYKNIPEKGAKKLGG